jgi:hypothetical protein
MQYKYAEIADTVYFWFAANGTDGAAGDGATPLYDVRLAGAAADAIPTASGTPTLLTHANYSDGLHEIAIDTTGYAAGEYAVFCTLTISSVNPAGFCGSFALRTAGTGALKVDAVAISGDTTAADNLELDYDGTGYAKANSTIGTCTTNTDMRGTEGAALATVCTETRLAELDAANLPADIDAIAGYLDTEIAAILEDTGTTLAAQIAALNDISVADIIAGVADGSYDLQEMLRVIFSVCAGKSAGGGTATLTFRDSADSKNRVSATVDANGNRTAMTLDAS